MTTSRSWRLPLAITLVLFAGSALAQQQQQRLTGALPDTTTTAITAPAPTPAVDTTQLPPSTSPFTDTTPETAVPTRPPRHEIGDVTRALLRMQAEGTYAGRALPILGDQASRSYQRYLNSFDYAIPERFEQTVSSSRSQ
jgi:hypothetical protein